MPYSISSDTKILTLAIAPFLLLFVGIIFEFAMVLGVYILLSPQEEEGHSSSWEHIQLHIINRKDLSFYYIMLLHPSCCWIGKNINKKFNCVMVLMVRPSSTLIFQFVFGFNEYLWENISLLEFKYFWIYIWVAVVYLWLLFDFMTQMTSSYLLPNTDEWKAWVQWQPIYITKF